MTTITIDLAEILEAKLQHGFHVPVSIDIRDLLDYADDDWDETLDLDLLLAGRHEAALIFSATDVRRLRPHLTDDQAWEVAEVTRDQFRHALDDFLGDVADENYPTAKRELQRRALGLKHRLECPSPDRPEATELIQQLAGVQRLITKLPDDAHGHPALEGSLAATLDDLERAFAGETPSEAREDGQ